MAADSGVVVSAEANGMVEKMTAEVFLADASATCLVVALAGAGLD